MTKPASGKLIDSIVAHFDAQSIRPITLPELGDATIYAKATTVADKTKWSNLSEGDTGLYMVYAIIYGYVYADGEPVFDIGDKVKLHKKTDNVLIGKLFDHLIFGVGKTDEDREKN